MKNLIFVFIFMTSFSFGQTNFDVMNPNATIVDSLVFEKIYNFQKEAYFKKIENNYVLQSVSKIFNCSVIYENNLAMSDSFRTTKLFFSHPFKVKKGDNNERIIYDVVASYENCPHTTLFLTHDVIGRNWEYEESKKLDSEYQIINGDVLGYIKYFYRVVNYPEIYKVDNNKYNRITITTTIDKLETYEEIAEKINLEIMKIEILNKKLNRKIGISCDFKQHKKQILTTLVMID